MKKLSKLDFSDFYYYAEQKFVSYVTSLFENPVRSVLIQLKDMPHIFWKSTGFNKRTISNDRTVSCNWNRGVAHFKLTIISRMQITNPIKDSPFAKIRSGSDHHHPLPPWTTSLSVTDEKLFLMNNKLYKEEAHFFVHCFLFVCLLGLMAAWKIPENVEMMRIITQAPV